MSLWYDLEPEEQFLFIYETIKYLEVSDICVGIYVGQSSLGYGCNIKELYINNRLNNVTMFGSKFQRIWSLLSWERTADLIRGKVKIEKKTEPGAK